MKKIIFFLLISFLVSCKTDPPPINIPDVLKSGECIVLLNGSKFDCVGETRFSSSGRILIGFINSLNDGLETRTFIFSFVPEKTGFFQLTSGSDFNGPVPNNRVFAGFNHILVEDLFGYQYTYIPDDDNHFIYITAVDKAARTIQGEGRASYKLVDKRDWSGFDLPNEMAIEFKFYLPY
jgi:hypothetical protein